MGRKSTKENKNEFQLAREQANLTREQASEALVYISDDRIEKIESEKVSPHPEEVLTMSECYKNPILTNYYCSSECPIGKKYVPALEIKDLHQITLEVLYALNRLDDKKKRLIEIAVDGKINDNERQDFNSIMKDLESISISANTLRLWLERMRYEENE